MTAVPGRLQAGQDGKITGPAKIGYENPFPTPAGSWGSGKMQGVVMHTEVGYDHNVQAEFATTAAGASATFSIDMTGHIQQYGPLGKGWYAWAQMAGNPSWYSIEHEDHGDPTIPLNDAQIAASAQVVELLSRFAGFPLQVTDDVNGTGYGMHCMGGAAWGGHTCPDTGPQHPVRSLQREAIIDLAKQIRAGTAPYVTSGTDSLITIATGHQILPSAVLRKTLAATADGLFPAPLAAYINAGDLRAPMPAGISLTVA